MQGVTEHSNYIIISAIIEPIRVTLVSTILLQSDIDNINNHCPNPLAEATNAIILLTGNADQSQGHKLDT